MKSIYKYIILPAIATMISSVALAQTENHIDSINDNGSQNLEIKVAQESLDAAADTAYMRGTEQDYIEAIKLYNEAIKKEGSSAAIYYNLGNAYYRVDSLAKAIINYERALRLDPTDEDIRANLEFVRAKLIDVQATDGITNVLVEKSMQMFSPNGWAIVSIVIFIGVLILVGGYIFSNNIRLRKIYFFTAIALFIINIISIIITINAASIVSGNKEAIIIAKSAQLSTSPSSESQKAMLLHEGSKVKVIRELTTPYDSKVKKWVEVEAAGDNRAWIDAKDIEII